MWFLGIIRLYYFKLFAWIVFFCSSLAFENRHQTCLTLWSTLVSVRYMWGVLCLQLVLRCLCFCTQMAHWRRPCLNQTVWFLIFPCQFETKFIVTRNVRVLPFCWAGLYSIFSAYQISSRLSRPSTSKGTWKGKGRGRWKENGKGKGKQAERRAKGKGKGEEGEE